MNDVNNKKIMQRFNIVVRYRKDKRKQKCFFSLISIMFLAIWLLSYLFIAQPAYNPLYSEIVDNDKDYEITPENAYIIKKKDGVFILKDFTGKEIEISTDNKEMMLKSSFEIREE